MPYAQVHYPFENKELIDKGTAFPANFIAEGVDQTRGWFFTLHAIATMVFDSVAYKAVISNGLVLDKNGIKMSKRLGNVINPFECIGTYGADAVRWYMITNSSPWDNLSFDPEGVKEVTSQFFIKLQQAYSFFAMYANVDGFEYKEADLNYADRPDFDRWLLSELNSLIKQVVTYFEDYDPTPAGRLIQTFVVDKLSNWYIRLNKARFWSGEMTNDKLSAYQTLYTCLETLSRLIAPISPFYADQLFRDLNAVTGKDNSGSVHLAKFPEYKEEEIDTELETAMEAAMKVTSMGLSIRKKVKIPVIQALQTLAIPDTDAEFSSRIERMKAIILKEVNVKELQLMDGKMLVKNVKCDFRVMGKKFGKLMKAVANAVAAMSQAQIAELESQGQITLQAEGQDAVIEMGDVSIMSQDIPGWSVANEGTTTVALDITITPALKNEGNARKLIKQIQGLRKSQGFEITDRIKVVVTDTPETQAVFATFKENIAAQVLANAIELGNPEGEPIDFEDFKAVVNVTKD
jgi:isoleucyl-tRNA synthetase